MPTLPWFDAHLDLAYAAVRGRDLLAPDPLRSGGLDQPASVTLPALAEANVRAALATIFIEPDGTGPGSYPAADPAAAHAAALQQLELYHTLRNAGHITFFSDVAPASSLPASASLSTPSLPPTPSLRLSVSSSLSSALPSLGLLIEGADGIRSPDDLEWWKSRGVVAVGLAWARSSRYAGGNATDLGLTDLGRALIRQIDRLHLVHDASHLSDRSFAQLLELTDRPVIASHSNSRALVGPGKDGAPNQRHLTDDAIREIDRRGGIIGLNLYSPFLIPAAARSGPARATLDHTTAHIEHVCEVVGHRRCIGLGSDMDGGFTTAGLPDWINHPRDLSILAEALRARGWSDDDVHAFTWGNWARFWKLE